MVGTDAAHVSDNARDAGVVPDVDFHVERGGLLQISDPGVRHSEETRSAYSDEYAENPIGIFIEQRTWVDGDPDRDDYLVAEFTIHNRSGAPITGLYAGLFFDWDFPWTGLVAQKDSGSYNASEGLGLMNHRETGMYRGLTVLSAKGTTSYRYFDNFSELFDADGFSERDKWNALSGGFQQTLPPAEGDGSNVIGTGPYSIDADSSVTVAFAIIGGTSEADLIASAQQAKLDYDAGEFNVAPGALQFAATLEGSDPSAQEIFLVNATPTAVDYIVDALPIWANVMPMSGSVPALTTDRLEVSVSIVGLALGAYNDSVLITATASGTEEGTVFRVPTTLIISEQTSDTPVDPNPYDPTTGRSVSLNFDLPEAARVYATVYDLIGEEVITLLNGEQMSAGPRSTTWDGKHDDEIVATGVYVCHVSAGEFQTVLKIVVKKP
jgi:hypothetical protein